MLVESMGAQKNEQEIRAAVLLARSKIVEDTPRKAAGQLYKRRQLCVEKRGGRFEHML